MRGARQFSSTRVLIVVYLLAANELARTLYRRRYNVATDTRGNAHARNNGPFNGLNTYQDGQRRESGGPAGRTGELRIAGSKTGGDRLKKDDLSDSGRRFRLLRYDASNEALRANRRLSR